MESQSVPYLNQIRAIIFTSDPSVQIFTSYSRSLSEDLVITLLPQATGGSSGVVATVGEAGSVCCCWGVGVDGRLTADSSSFWEPTADWSSIMSLMVIPSWAFSSLTTKRHTNTKVKYRHKHTGSQRIFTHIARETSLSKHFFQQDNRLVCVCLGKYGFEITVEM